MNKEPKVKLPEPPEGKRWEYVGLGASFNGECCYMNKNNRSVVLGEADYGLKTLHYWKAVDDNEDPLQTAIDALKVALKALQKITK